MEAPENPSENPEYFPVDNEEPWKFFEKTLKERENIF